MAAAVVHPGVIDETRRVDHIAHAQRIPEARGHNADDRVSQAIQLDRRADNIAIAAEVALPYLVTQDDNLVLAFQLLAGQIGAPKQRLHAEYLKEIVGGVHSIEQHRAARRRFHGDGKEIDIAGQCRESVDLLPLVLVTGP